MYIQIGPYRKVCDGEFKPGPYMEPRCHRRAPVILSFPLSDENNRHLGIFTMLAGEEAADAAFAFGARNGVSAGGLGYQCYQHDTHLIFQP